MDSQDHLAASQREIFSILEREVINHLNWIEDSQRVIQNQTKLTINKQMESLTLQEELTRLGGHTNQVGRIEIEIRLILPS